MTTYRAGIVGLTGIATAPAAGEPAIFGGEQPHAHAASYAAVPETEVVAICELDTSLFDQFDARWGHRWPKVARYTDYRELIEREKLDLISVVTSDHRHADIVVDAANAGVKGIFCEKPIATTLADADRMIAAVEKNGAKMIVNHTRRWFPDYVRARELIRSGRLGSVARINLVMGGPRAMLFRNGTHLLDVAVYLAESEPVWVVGQLDPGHEHYGPAYAGRGGRDPAYDPGATALIKFANGAIASYHGTKQVTPGYGSWEVTVYGEKGTLRIREPGVPELTIHTEDPFGSPYGSVATQALPSPQYVHTDGAAVVRELIDLIEHPGDGTRQGQCPPREARKVLAILLAILQSQHRGNVPVTAPFADPA
jgi:UDP-N-acetyl-2-amino-2-deoxyglucuronate dehydrogenase